MRCGDASAGRPISRTHDDAGHATDSTECSIRHERTQIVRHDGWWACGCGKPYGPEHLAEIAAIGKGANMDMEAVRAHLEHIWGNPEDCPGCRYSNAVVKRQTGLTGEDSGTEEGTA